MAKKQKIKTGTIEIPENEFDPKHTKMRISMMLHCDVIDEFKRIAARERRPYQVLMQEKLREAVFGKQISDELRDAIRQAVLEEIEKAS